MIENRQKYWISQVNKYLTLSYLGGGAKRPRFGRLVVTPRRLHLSSWNFLTFPKYKKTKFWTNFEFKFLPQPPSEGVLKKWKFSILVIEPKLQNMIYRTHKKRNKSKIWALYLKNWASYGNFCKSRVGEISITPPSPPTPTPVWDGMDNPQEIGLNEHLDYLDEEVDKHLY